MFDCLNSFGKICGAVAGGAVTGGAVAGRAVAGGAVAGPRCITSFTCNFYSYSHLQYK